MPIIGEVPPPLPGIELQLHSSEGFINLMERRVDTAIRIGELTDSLPGPRRSGTIQAAAAGVPDYSEGARVPRASRRIC